MNAVNPLKELAYPSHTDAVLVQEPYLYKAFGQTGMKVRGWSNSNIQPINCKEDQRVSSIILAKQAANVIIPSLKPANILINRIQNKGIELVLISIYFPPRYVIEDMIALLTQTIHGIKGDAAILIAGDFNTRSTTWGDSIDTGRGNELEDFFTAEGFDILNRQDSGFTFQSASKRSSAVYRHRSL
jgi:hypothetical protein